MNNRVGIIGPPDSVNLISEIATEFSDQITPVPYIYANLNEVTGIINNHQDEIDVWLFSGQAPYAIAKADLKPQTGFHPPLNGSSLTKVLLDISYKDKKQLTNLSFDTIASKDVLETFSEFGLATKGLKINAYAGYKPPEELVEFHYELYKNNEVDCCITSVHSVYEALKKLNVSAYRIKPTINSIRKTIFIASQRSEINHLKSTQISILILQLYEMNKLIGEGSISFDTHRLNLKIQNEVIEFTEKIHGSFIQQGNDKFIIYSTRGSLESYSENEIYMFLEKITSLTKLTANIGIGHGKTVFGAEQNAYTALNHANNYGKNTIILIHQDGSIEGPLENQNSITYSRRIDDKQIIDKLKLAGVSVSTYNKLVSIQKKLAQHSVSAFDIAEWLNMTQRNARRILGSLEKYGLAEVIGEETPGPRGRPRRLFRVGLKETPVETDSSS